MTRLGATRPAAPAGPAAQARLPIAVVILTRDEELNLGHCLASVADWAGQVFVVDSGSVDGTVEVARRYGAQVASHPFEGYSEQRNWALDHLPLEHDWVFTLDADEQVSPELAGELHRWFGGADPVRARLAERLDGFYIKRRLIFMGRWIRHGGYYPVWLLRLYRRSAARWDGRSVNEHVAVRGDTGKLQHDIVHHDHRDLSHWTVKHTRYAALEASELLSSEPPAEGRGALFGAQAERKRWIRRQVWNRMPLFWRPVSYFLYRYVLRGGFLDGRPGLVYHFLQGLWYPFLIDAKVLEAKHTMIPVQNGSVGTGVCPEETEEGPTPALAAGAGGRALKTLADERNSVATPRARPEPW